ncbi:MAG: hypothetical protein ACYSU7_01485 [Planctomycetota bacterium]|jgi:hypothetical protein
MKTTYNIRRIQEDGELLMSEKSADTVVSLYGARGKVSINTVIIHRSEALLRERPFTSIRLAFAPMVNNDDSDGWEDCAYRGVVRVPDSSTGVRRQIEQVLRPYRGIYVSVVDLTDMTEGGAPLGRRVVRAMLRRFEALLEYSRRSIRDGFADHVRDLAIRYTHRAFGETTAHSATMLGTLHWRLLLEGSECGAECLDTVEYTTAHNPPQFLELVDDGEMNVESLVREAETGGAVLREIRHQADMLIRQQQQAQRDAEQAQRVAERAASDAASRARAIELMRSVCGDEVTEQFARNNRIVLEHEGYTFTLSPDGMIPCRDPDGKKALLCIHTRGFCCHAIDEIIIAYLNIRHSFEDYMGTANVFRADPGFRKPSPAKKSRPLWLIRR